MPTISLFYGIAIRMYYNDHAPPHFHAIYGGDEAIVEIGSGVIIGGGVPLRAEKLVAEWTELNRDRLMANWTSAREGNQMERIPGLDAQ